MDNLYEPAADASRSHEVAHTRLDNAARCPHPLGQRCALSTRLHEPQLLLLIEKREDRNKSGARAAPLGCLAVFFSFSISQE
jgi:hypothetical protein